MEDDISVELSKKGYLSNQIGRIDNRQKC